MKFDAENTLILEKGGVTLPKRARDVNKYDCGRVLIIGGCTGYTGAPVMCAMGALRAGAGLVSVGVPASIYPIVAAKLLEAMPFPLPADDAGRLSPDGEDRLLERLEKCDACVIGPGLGRGDGITALVRAVTRNSAVPLIMDADALYAAALDMSIVKNASCPVIVTPHTGEFGRMGGVLTGNPAADARDFSDKYGCVTVLKGPDTAVAFPGGETVLSRFGNPGMAVGGTGDVLAGLAGGLCAQLPIKQGVTAAVYIHALAGDACRDRLGEYSMLPGDMIEAIPEVTKNMIR